ncbi:hypothetical protein [Streptomyces sp. NPDC048057]|uniref:hypothetical protein n=1 Tax=Streptomyces sp. NPDC048057 TaxID=3155628 RepID=UPI0033D7528C
MWRSDKTNTATKPRCAGPALEYEVVGQDDGMTTWFRTYYEDEDLFLYFEDADDGWSTRQVEVRGGTRDR